MFFYIDGLPLEKYIEHFFQQVILADVQAQILQQNGWIEFQKSMKNADDFDMAEGSGQAAYLGLREVKISFYVEPVCPGLLQRIKRLYGYLFGRPSAPARQMCRIVPGSKFARSAFMLTLTVSRSADGDFKVKTEPGIDQCGGVYVSDIMA